MGQCTLYPANSLRWIDKSTYGQEPFGWRVFFLIPICCCDPANLRASVLAWK